MADALEAHLLPAPLGGPGAIRRLESGFLTARGLQAGRSLRNRNEPFRRFRRAAHPSSQRARNVCASVFIFLEYIFHGAGAGVNTPAAPGVPVPRGAAGPSADAVFAGVMRAKDLSHLLCDARVGADQPIAAGALRLRSFGALFPWLTCHGAELGWSWRPFKNAITHETKVNSCAGQASGAAPSNEYPFRSLTALTAL